jgi:glucokinase
MACSQVMTTGVIGVDVGGTNIKVGLLTEEGTLHYSTHFKTQSHRSPKVILADVAEAVTDVQRQAQADDLVVDGIGIGLPATTDLAQRHTLIMPNFAAGWFEFPAAEVLEKYTGLRVSLINDARAFVLAESKLGAGQGCHNVFGIVLGTGVGGGMVVDGRLYLGSSGLAGEFGHYIIDPQGVRCGCGSVGCLETVASAPALVASVVRSLLHGRSPILYDMVEGDLNALTAEHISRAAREGDAVCLEALQHVAEALGVATASVAVLVGPERIVVGGGLAGTCDILFPIIEATWQRHAVVLGERLPQLVTAKLSDPGVIGAALYARQVLGEVAVNASWKT